MIYILFLILILFVFIIVKIIYDKKIKNHIIHEVFFNFDKFKTDAFCDDKNFRDFIWEGKYTVTCWHQDKYAIIYKNGKRIINQFDDAQLSKVLYNSLMNYFYL